MIRCRFVVSWGCSGSTYRSEHGVCAVAGRVCSGASLSRSQRTRRVPPSSCSLMSNPKVTPSMSRGRASVSSSTTGGLRSATTSGSFRLSLVCGGATLLSRVRRGSSAGYWSVSPAAVPPIAPLDSDSPSE